MKGSVVVFPSVLFFLTVAPFLHLLGPPESYGEDAGRAAFLETLLRLTQADRATKTVRDYEIVKTYPHDANAFTQGLVFHEGFLYESTGINGRSTLRKIKLETGKLLKIHHVPVRYFGEGLTLWQDNLIQLTWRSRTGFIYDKYSFAQLRDFRYTTEGWGITHDGSHLIMSDGTATLHFLDPHTFLEVRQLEVRDGDVPIFFLNELEYINGEIYANVWGMDYIVKIAPTTGQVIGWVDLTRLRSLLDDAQGADVLNGIAYDPATQHLFVTGKFWQRLFEIKLH
jgi:glutamine cyclotransferase